MSLLKIAIFGLLGLPISAAQTKNPAYSIAVIDGQGALNNVQARAAHQTVIQVSDRNHKPVVGAYVEFDTPKSGAGAIFANGTTHFSCTTNADGLATAAGLRNNGVAGSFVIMVHVSFEGQSLGEVDVKEANVTRKVADISDTLHDTGGSHATDSALSTSVFGIALGDQFLLNGSPTPSNANLFKDSRLQTQGTAVTIFLHDKCEFLIGPHSSIVLSEHLVHVESGAVRAKDFGSCKMGFAALWVQGVGSNAGGVIAITGTSMEVAAVSGQEQVINTTGEVISTINAGSSDTFDASPVASGASAGSPGLSRRGYVFVGTGVAASLVGLGLAVDNAVQHSSTSP
jgi:hypothetical protein